MLSKDTINRAFFFGNGGVFCECVEISTILPSRVSEDYREAVEWGTGVVGAYGCLGDGLARSEAVPAASSSPDLVIGAE